MHTYFSNSSPPRMWSQAVELTGLGLPFFKDYIAKIREVETIVSRHLKDDSLTSWNAGDDEDDPVFRASTNYFSDRHDKGQQEVLPIPNVIDPKGLLAKSLGNKFVYLEENNVEYL